MNKPHLIVAIMIALAIGVTLVVLSGVGGAASDGNRATYSGSAGPGFASESVSALNRTAVATDAITAAQLGSAATHISDLAAARFVRVDGTQRIYIAPGRDGTICLVIIDSTDQSATTDCADRTTLASGSVYISTPNLNTRTEDVVGLVGDGVRSVVSSDGSVAHVLSNVFVVHNLHGQILTLNNSAGAQSAVDLGEQFPPGS